MTRQATTQRWMDVASQHTWADPAVLRQAKPGRGGRTPNDLSNRKPLTVTRRVKVPNRKGLAIHRNRVLRGAGATRLRSVHRGRLGRVIEPRKIRCGADVVEKAEGHSGRAESGLARALHRGLRAGHGRKGHPGTWEGSVVPRQ